MLKRLGRSYLLQADLVESNAPQCAQLACLASLRFVVHGDSRDVDIGGKLLGNLRYDIGKLGRRVDGEPKLALSAHEPEDHGCMYGVEGVGGGGWSAATATEGEKIYRRERREVKGSRRIREERLCSEVKAHVEGRRMMTRSGVAGVRVSRQL